MPRTGKVAVSITADPDGLQRGLRRAEGDLDRFGDHGTRSLGALKTAALGAGIALTGALVVGLKASVDAAIEAEKSQARMEAQLKALGISYDAHGAKIDAVIQKTSQLAGLDDEELQDAFTNVVRASGDVNKSLEQMTLVADLARAKHIDVAKAGDIVGKVMNGNTGILGRYGITLKEGATATEALGALHQKFAGQAEAYGKTTAGAQDRFRVATENLKEAVGAELLPVLTKVATAASNFVGQMQSGKGVGGDFARTMKDVFSVVKVAVEAFVSVGRAVLQSKVALIALGTALGGLALTRTVSRVKELAEGFSGLSKASKFGALATAVALVSTAISLFSGKQRDAAETARDLTDALEEERNALKRVRDLDLDAAQAKVQVRVSTRTLADAERELAQLRKSGTASARSISEAEDNVAQARIQTKRDTRALRDAEKDATATRQAAARATDDAIKATNEHGEALLRAMVKGKDTRAELERLKGTLNTLKNERIDIDVSQAVANVNSASNAIQTMINKIAELKRQSARAGASSVGTAAAMTGSAAGAKMDANYESITGGLELVDLRLGAGEIKSADAEAQRLRIINQALKAPAKGGKALSQADRLRLKGERRSIRRTQAARVSGKAGVALRKLLAKIDDLEAQGDVSEAKADEMRKQVLDAALADKYGKLNARDRVAVRTMLHDLASKNTSDSPPDPVEGFADSTVTDLDPAASMQGQLDQANLRAQVAQRAAAISGAELSTFQGAGTIGYGGPVIVFKVGETEFARAAVQSLNSQPAITTSRTTMGV